MADEAKKEPKETIPTKKSTTPAPDTAPVVSPKLEEKSVSQAAKPEKIKEASDQPKKAEAVEIKKSGKESIFNDLRPGQTIKVYQNIKQGDKDRVQVFDGVVIAIKGKELISRTITVRKISSGNFGVEKIFPLSSPMVAKIEIIHTPKRVRRSKLYYLRQSPRKIKELREKK